MLSSQKRLRAAEVRDIIAQGGGARSRRAGVLSVKYTTSGTLHTRAAAVVSKKVARSAIVRNRLRRALYRAVAQGLSEGSVPPGLNLVFFVQRVPTAPLTVSFANDITQLCLKPIS